MALTEEHPLDTLDASIASLSMEVKELQKTVQQHAATIVAQASTKAQIRNSLDEVLRSLHRIERQQSSSAHLPLLFNPPLLFPTTSAFIASPTVIPPSHPQSPSHSLSETSQTPNRNDRQPLPSANFHVLPTPSQIQSSVDGQHHSLVRIEQHQSKQPPLPFEMSPSRSPSPSITASSSHLRLPSTAISYFCSHPRSSAKSEAFKELEVAERQHTSGTILSIFPKALTEIAHPLSQDENQPLTASATVPLHPPPLPQTTIATDTSTTPQISQFINEIRPSLVASPSVTVHPPSLPQSQPHTSIPTSLRTSPTPPDATTLLHLPIPQPAMASFVASVQPQAYHLSNSTSTIVPF